MSLAKRMDALKAKGFRFTVGKEFAFKPEKLYTVTLPGGTELKDQFADIAEAVKFCESL